jgi:DNA-binding NarL/FixJ family response regulator
VTPRRSPATKPIGAAPPDLRAKIFRGADGRDYAALWFSRRHDERAALSGAQREVAEMILAGFSNEAIAAVRRVGKATVATQVRSLFAKLRVSSRAELIGRLLD